MVATYLSTDMEKVQTKVRTGFGLSSDTMWDQVPFRFLLHVQTCSPDKSLTKSHREEHRRRGHPGKIMVQVNQHDLEFILRQIKIAEANSIAHSGDDAVELTNIWVDELGNVVPEGTPGATLAISAEHVPYGLRTVDGSFNNLGAGREDWGSADQPFERLLEQGWRVETDDTINLLAGFGPGGPSFTTLSNSTYSPSGAVVDADPRTISNLIVDQTLSNPAAIYTALVQAGYTGDLMTAVNAIRADFAEALLEVTPASTAPFKTDAVLIAEATKLLAPVIESEYGIKFDGPSILIENVAPDEVSRLLTIHGSRCSASSSTTASTWCRRVATKRFTFRSLRMIRFMFLAASPTTWC